MTEKRFTYEYNGNLFDNEMNTFYHIEDSDENIELFCDNLNSLVEENEQLKQREENLLSEIDDFQQLLTKNDNICCKRVIDLIDVRIKNGEEAIEWGKNMNADYGAMGFHIEMLKKLKKELQE